MSHLVNAVLMRKAVKNEKGNPTQLQWKTLKKILSLSNKTEFGKKYDFDSINSIEDYQQRVPIMHYEDVAPYWDREAAGEKRVILNRPPQYFVETSGTTGIRKLIPITPYLLSSIRETQKIAVGALMQNNPNIRPASKKLLHISSRITTTETKGGIPIGMISGIIYKTASYMFKRLVIPSSEKTVNCEGSQEKLQLYAQEVVGKKVGTVTGIPTSALDLLTYLKAELSEEEYKYCFGDVEMVISSGINYRPYLKQFNELLGENILFVDYYMSSEGPYACGAPENLNALQLFNRFTFFEFVPIENYRLGDYSERLTVENLEVGKQYAIAVTTGNATFSYIIGDVIECYSNDPIRIKIAGRTQLTLNIASEKTSITQVEAAVEKFSNALDIDLKEFFLAENYESQKPSYCWYFEETESLTRYTEEELSKHIDLALSDTNPLFDYFINDNVIMEPSCVKFISRDDINQWFDSKGADPNHRKLPRIIPKREIVDAIVNPVACMV